MKPHLKLWFTIRNSQMLHPSPRVASAPNRTKPNQNWFNHLHKPNYTSLLAGLRRSFLLLGLPKKILDSQKQPFFKIGTLKDFTIFTRKPLCWSLILIKPATLLKRLQHRCFLVNIVKFLRKIFLEHLRWLLLDSPHLPIPLTNTRN